MIASIEGQVLFQGPDHLIVRVGGVGVRVIVPHTVFDYLDGVGQKIFLHTHLSVREDALTLFGFVEESELRLFEILINVSGIGPRLAIAIVGTLSLNQIGQAVSRDEPELLTRVPGIGKKTAQKIILELKDKLQAVGPVDMVTINDMDTDVMDALTALGYSIVEAQAAVQSIPKDAPQVVEDRVLLALSYFT